MINQVVDQDFELIVKTSVELVDFSNPSNDNELLEYMAKIALDNIMPNNPSNNCRERAISHNKCVYCFQELDCNCSELSLPNLNQVVTYPYKHSYTPYTYPRDLRPIPEYCDELYSVTTITSPDVVIDIIKKS